MIAAATTPRDVLDANILIVDNDVGNVQMLEHLLRGAGYTHVSSTHDSGEVCTLHRLNDYDLILLDLEMPGLNGFEVIAALRSDTADSYLRVIALTVHPGHKLRALQSGAKDFIAMPVDMAEVLTRIRSMLEVRLLHKRLETYNQMLERSNHALASANEKLETRQVGLAEANLELARASQFKSEFLSTMSHELRTPLNAIIGFAELLRGGRAGALDARQREFVGYIADSGSHLLSLINDILDLSKIEAGKVELDLEPIDLDGLLKNSVAMVREPALLREIVVDCGATGNSLPMLVDQRRLKQIIYNLLSNAVKFTAPGGRVSVRANTVDRHQASSDLPGFPLGVRTALPPNSFQTFAQITVTDTGLGLSREDMDRLFTPFTQIKNALTRSMEGTGLGLVAVSRLAELHGGAVAVTSSPGVGSCFSVWLPWRIGE